MAVLRREKVIPVALTSEEHPIEQVVGTCLAVLKADLKDAQHWRERHSQESQQNGQHAQELWKELNAVREFAKTLGWDFQARNDNLVLCLQKTIHQLRTGAK